MSIKRSLLLVDDDGEFVDILTRRFLKLGYAVTALNHPREAMQAVSFSQFDAAVIDQGLPETDGIDLMQQLLGRIDLRVIILSGFAHPALKRKALRLGAFAYLLKPCKFVKLKSAVDQALLAKPIPVAGHVGNAGLAYQGRCLVPSRDDLDVEQLVTTTEPETPDEFVG